MQLRTREQGVTWHMYVCTCILSIFAFWQNKRVISNEKPSNLNPSVSKQKLEFRSKYQVFRIYKLEIPTPLRIWFELAGSSSVSVAFRKTRFFFSMVRFNWHWKINYIIKPYSECIYPYTFFISNRFINN